MEQRIAWRLWQHALEARQRQQGAALHQVCGISMCSASRPAHARNVSSVLRCMQCVALRRAEAGWFPIAVVFTMQPQEPPR